MDHKLSLWKNTKQTNFIHFAKMVSSSFQRTFFLFWHKVRCIELKKKFFFVKKMLIIQFPFPQQKLFQVILKLPQNFFVFFFNRISNFILKQTWFKKNLIICLHNVVQDTLILDFFLYCSETFFINAKSLLFCMACFSMHWPMSDNLKIQILKIILVETFCQKLKVWYFRFIFWARQK